MLEGEKQDLKKQVNKNNSKISKNNAQIIDYKSKIEDLKSQSDEFKLKIDELKAIINEKDDQLSKAINDSKKITKLKKEIKEKDEIIGKMEEESKELNAEIEIENELNLKAAEYLAYYYSAKTFRNSNFGENFCMSIDWCNANDKEVFRLANTIRLKEIKKLCFWDIGKEESIELLDYLVTNCPKNLRIFEFSANTLIGYCSGEFYLKGILKVI